MRRLLLVVIVFLMMGSAVAQSGPELDALLDAFFAKDLKSLAPHLPPELADVITHLPADRQQELASRYLFAVAITHPGVAITRADSGPVVVMEQSCGDVTDPVRTEVYVDKYLSGGSETMLRFRMKSQTRYWEGATIIAWMKYVDREWRIYELDGYGREVHLDDPQYVESLRRRPATQEEQNAVDALRNINTAVATYASIFSDYGSPISLQALGPVTTVSEQVMTEDDSTPDEGDNAPTPDHAGLMDATLTSPPFESSGYRFAYTKLSQSGYAVVARPMTYSSLHEYSYFTDQSGVIRFTTEDRDPTADDPPLQ